MQSMLAAFTDSGGERRRMMEHSHAAFGRGDVSEYQMVLEHCKWTGLGDISLRQNNCLNS